MPTALETRSALRLVTAAAVDATAALLGSVSGAAKVQRSDLLDAVPQIIAYYADGTAALAADYYDDERARAGAAGRFLAEPLVPDRAVKIGRAIAWATQPLIDGTGDTAGRLAEVVQLETARPFRQTIVENRRRDPQAAGWRRVTVGGCRLCRMLADRGAVYRESTVRFASHPNCNCSAEPVFRGTQEASAPSASVMQYTASKRRPSEKDRQRLREYLAKHYDD